MASTAGKRFNELNQSLFGGVSTTDAELETLFRHLTDYAEHHFADEEGLMGRANLDSRHIKAHCEEHAQFVEQVHSMWTARRILKLPAAPNVRLLVAPPEIVDNPQRSAIHDKKSIFQRV